MSSYLSSHARGGAIASKVDQQDAVALWLSLDLFRSSEHLGFSSGTEITVACEQNEDLCISGDMRRVMVSVKNSNLGTKEFKDELKRLAGLVTAQNAAVSMIALVGPVDKTLTQAVKHDQEYRSLIQGKSAAEINNVRKEFDSKYGDFFNANVILQQFPELDADAFKAGIAQLLRRALPISDYSDDRIDGQIIFLTARFASARRQRGTVSLNDVAQDVLSLASNPLARAVLKGSPYKRSSTGYVPDRARESELRDVYSQTIRAQRAALRDFRKRHFWHAVAWLIIGAPGCHACGHPLLANFSGLGRLGIACPDCGASPFITLYLACPCGHALTLLEQPPIDDFAAFNLAMLTAVRGLTCEKCGRDASYEDLDLRIFQLNIPADTTITVVEALQKQAQLPLT